mgnify:CR=1 FL=1
MRQEQGKKKSIWKEMISWILYLLILFGAVYVIVHYVGERTQVRGDSMYPSLADGDNLIVDKISYRFSDPKRYDIVVFPFQYQEGTFYIKRVIGLPGETVQIQDGNIYINRTDMNRSAIRGLLRKRLRSVRMSILSWVTTAITALTAENRVWAAYQETL